MLNTYDIVVFGLEDRVDRWQRAREILENEGVAKITRFATQRHENKYKGVAEDFMKLLRIKRKMFLFFEDDFELTADWQQTFIRSVKDLPDDFDLLYLGLNLTKEPKKVTENLYRVRGGWCFHAVLISEQFIEFVLRKYDVNCRQVFDEWLRIIAQQRKFYMTYPMIAYQRPSYSDFVGKEVDYKIFQNKYYAHINNRSRLSSGT